MEENILSFITGDYAALVPVMWVLGYIIKKSPIKDWLIPWIVVVISIGLSAMLKGFNATAVVQGILIAASAVFGNQILKQTIKKES